MIIRALQKNDAGDSGKAEDVNLGICLLLIEIFLRVFHAYSLICECLFKS